MTDTVAYYYSLQEAFGHFQQLQLLLNKCLEQIIYLAARN